MPKYYEFEVALQDIEPRIWRRFLLPVTATFRHLHDAIQAASGAWLDCHLHSFLDPDQAGEDWEEICGSPPDPDDIFASALPHKSSRKMRLKAWFPTTIGNGPLPKCVYAYDFGDEWKVDVQLCGIVEEPSAFRRRLIAGERRFPADDCGGLSGYEQCCLALAWSAGSPLPVGVDRDELDARLEWLGTWRPDDWNLEAERPDFESRAIRYRVRW